MVDLEVTEHAFDPVALPVEALALEDQIYAIRLRQDNTSDPTLLQIITVSSHSTSNGSSIMVRAGFPGGYWGHKVRGP